MFYVIYLLKVKKFVVIPINWVKEYEKHWHKFINYGINSGQSYLVYYTEKAESKNENGEPYGMPNFFLSLNKIFPNEGCYLDRKILW